jgi:HD superfamily phosphohydrolase
LNSISTNKHKIINDPVYGFVNIPNALIFDLIQHPYFQRLRRISQMGMSFLVYPGAHHTRFHHAIGCLHLMIKAVRTLRRKGVDISNDEETGLYVAILLHDIGHGPFSHALENSIVKGCSHEDISLRIMQKLNLEFKGKLDVGIEIFKGNYPKNFLKQLVSSQLDIDRLDYLKRDSFYTGVVEGSINSDRLISMMTVYNDELVIEEKGLYSVEKFLIARRLMYWQVYLHKTGVVAERMLVEVMNRAKELYQMDRLGQIGKSLAYFMEKQDISELEGPGLQNFLALDDTDIFMALKQWRTHKDKVLSFLAAGLLDRKLLKITMDNKPVSDSELDEFRQADRYGMNLSENEISYLVFSGSLENTAYNPSKSPIKILKKSGMVVDFINASDHMSFENTQVQVKKYFFCHPKN